MNLVDLKIIYLTESSRYSTLVIYQKHSQSSEVFCKDQFSDNHCFYSIWTTLKNVYAILFKYTDDTVIYISRNDSELIQKKLNADILEVHMVNRQGPVFKFK